MPTLKKLFPLTLIYILLISCTGEGDTWNMEAFFEKVVAIIEEIATEAEIALNKLIIKIKEFFGVS